MCDQTEVIYAPGDVVWVKLGPVWWPSQVQDYDKLPDDITANLRKRPIAVVKFFQEDAFEYVKNLEQIYHYNCRKKHEFIKKGLDMCRSSNRNVPSNMKMFPNDIATAEHLTHGDPNILNDPEFQPEQKEDYRELFGKKPPKKSKLDHVKEWRIRSLGESAYRSSTKNGRQSLQLTPRAVTHPRFINKALGKGSDHEVRIRSQSNDLLQSSGKLYNCHLCGFSASRINVIILHNKSHSAGYADAFLPSTPSGNKSKKRSTNEKRPKTSLASDKSKSDEPPVKRKSLAENKLQVQDANPGSPSKNVSSTSPARKPIFGRKRSAKDKAEKAAKEKRQTDEFRENLLKDWDDDDDNGSSTEDKSDLADKGDTDSKEAKTDDSKKTPTKETSCFDFDDSEDGIKPEETIMQFGRKIPRLLGDKGRKRKSECEDPDDKEVAVEPKEMTKVSSEDKPVSEEESIEERKSREEKEEKDKKAKEEFDMAFKALLEETVAPTIPDAFESSKSKDKQDLLGEASVNETKTESSLVDDVIVPPDPPEETELTKMEVVEEVVECVAIEDNQHFLVKTSGEGATTSPDKEISETKVTLCDSSNVAHPPVENFELAKELVAHVEEIVEQTTEFEEVVDFKVDETVVKTEEECTKSLLPEEHPAESSKCQGFLSNDFVDDCIVDNYCSIEQSAQSSPKVNKTPQSNNESNLVEISESPKKIANESKSTGLSQFIVVTSNANETSNVITSMSESVNSMYQGMDFDIDSMPVIIGDDMTQEEQGQGPVFQAVETTVVPQKVQKKQPLLPMLSSKSSAKPVENKVVTVISSSGQLSKINQSELKQVKKPTIIKKDQPTMVRIPTTIDNKITRKVILSPSKKLNTPVQSTAVRIAASTSQVGKLSVPGLVTTQKGIVQNATGAGQVLILKSSGTGSKATLQKMPQVIQPAGGNKVLILTSTPGASGQKVLGTLAAPQKTITGTRYLTTTKAASVVVGKGAGNTCKKILIDKSGAISQAPKSVIIDKGGLSALSRTSTALLTSSSDSIATLSSKLTIAGSSKAAAATTTTILASSAMSGKKGVILTPISGKGATVADNQKLRLIASKSSSSVSGTTGAKLVISSPQSRILVPSVATKNQPIKLISSKAQPNSGNTILIQTNQGVLGNPSFSGAVQNQTVISSKPQAKLITTPKAHILHTQNMFQAQSKKLATPKKSASPNILQKTQRKPVQRGTKKNFITEQTALFTRPSPAAATATATTPAPATQDVLLLPSMKNMPVVSQGTILQGTTVDSEGRKSYVYLTVDEHGNYRPLETAPVLDFNVASTSEQVQSVPQVEPQQQTSSSQPIAAAETSTIPTPPQSTTSISTSSSTQQAQLPPQQTLYFDPGTTDLDSLLLAIDEAGNVVNISQQQQSTVAPQTKTAEVEHHSGQDILAKALADTQVLQQESTAIASDPVTSSMLGCVFVESLPPAPSLAHNVLETSTTLNQTPIMTPLEMPSAVSSLQTNILPQIQSDFLKSNTLVDPSMPLLSEDATEMAKSNKTIFVSTSDSADPSLAFQLSIGADNNIIVSSSGADISSSLAAFITTTSVTQTSADSVVYDHATAVEDQPTSGKVEQQVAVEQQVVTESVPSEVYAVTFDLNDAQKTMDSAASIDYHVESSSSIPSMEAKTDFDEGAFNVEETTTMSVASSEYDLSISDSAKTTVALEQASASSASDHHMSVQKLSFDSDKQR